jgi:hypothetical protein
MNKTNKTNSQSHICPHCGRNYVRKFHFDRHVIACQILNEKTVRERTLEMQEREYVPNLREIFIMVQELGKKYQDISNKLDVLNKYVEKKKKRLNLVDWLNDNYVCQNIFDSWLKSLSIKREHFEKLFHYNLTDCILFYFQDVFPLSNEDQIQDIPLKAFNQKENTFFIYTENKEWQMMSYHSFESFIQHILKLFTDEFKYWQDENMHKMKDEVFMQKYMTTVRKIMGGDIPREKL